ncbi:PadR family transcriptional regulator [Tardiphaga sp. 11_C7_N12_6]|uniref:PadR family transcriptional regulator n=1 Tax=Tardiphaga sp. 11_C7_N12_6 TaxID=3240789 RepID=UPI003F215373
MAEDDTKLTLTGLKLLGFFSKDPSKKWSGAEITREIGIGSGSLYPLLAKFENSGWLDPEWEVLDPSEAGRPRRRYYSLTAIGARAAQRELSQFQLAPSIGSLAWVS